MSKGYSKLKNEHSPDAIAKRLSKEPSLSYLRDWVYGGIDGTVTTFAVVSGVVGAQLSVETILILGMSNVLADGFSMAASNYLGTKAESDERRHYRKIEESHIDRFPEGEKEEVRQILRRKGFDGELLEKATDALTSDRDRWINVMLAEEYNFPLFTRSPSRAAFSTFAAFAFCGVLPLLPFFLGVSKPFLVAGLITAVIFFSIGSLKSRWSPTSWLLSGAQTLAIGSAAAAIAFGAGKLLGNLR